MRDLRFGICEEEGSILFTLFTKRHFSPELALEAKRERAFVYCEAVNCLYSY